MQSGEEQIRQLVATWMKATKSGDAETVLSLISGEAVFLATGQPVMHKSDFAAAAGTQSSRSSRPSKQTR